MNKKELIAKIAQSTGLPQAQVARALDSTIGLIRDELVDKPKKTARALDSEIQLIRDPARDRGRSIRRSTSSPNTSSTPARSRFTASAPSTPLPGKPVLVAIHAPAPISRSKRALP